MRKTHLIIIILIAVSIGAILGTISDSSTYATFSVAKQHPEEEFHVVGKLNKTKETEYDPAVNANLFSFYMVDNDGTERKVLFNGTKPQDFERSEQIVIIGKVKGQEFCASKILMKCPSKYNNGEVEVTEASAQTI